jgi:hypothetical protein
LGIEHWFHAAGIDGGMALFAGFIPVGGSLSPLLPIEIVSQHAEIEKSAHFCLFTC